MSLKKTLALASVTALALGALATGASAGAFVPGPTGDDTQSRTSAGVFSIEELETDAMGGDSWFNRNDESVKVKNNSAADQVITGFKVGDKYANDKKWNSACNVFAFAWNRVPADMRNGGTGVVLKAGHSVTVKMGAGTPATTSPGNHVVYDNSPKPCGANGHVINNDGDDLYFVDASKVVQASATFDRKGGYEVTF